MAPQKTPPGFVAPLLFNLLGTNEDEENINITQQQPREISSGFHVFEIHWPTVTASGVVVLLIIMAIFAVMCCPSAIRNALKSCRAFRQSDSNKNKDSDNENIDMKPKTSATRYLNDV